MLEVWESLVMKNIFMLLVQSFTWRGPGAYLGLSFIAKGLMVRKILVDERSNSVKGVGE